METSKNPLYVRQLPIIFTPSHTCTVSFFLLVGEETDDFDEYACVKRMETQDIDKPLNPRPYTQYPEPKSSELHTRLPGRLRRRRGCAVLGSQSRRSEPSRRLGAQGLGLRVV